MTPSRRAFLWWWIGGLVAFGVVIYFHQPLITQSVPGGIVDHQSAPDAATVDAIQRSWRLDGVQNEAGIAMMLDLIFIVIYGIGCVLAGLYFRAGHSALLRRMGNVALAAGLVFLIADLGETTAQLVQFMRFEGDDALARLASTLRPVKMAGFVVSFLAVISALAIEWKSRHSA